MAVVTLIAALVVLMIRTFPLEESGELSSFYALAYYTIMVASPRLAPSGREAHPSTFVITRRIGSSVQPSSSVTV